jgi:hypothetical protein
MATKKMREATSVKVIVLSAIVALVLAFAAASVLDSRFQQTSADRFTTTGVRLNSEG